MIVKKIDRLKRSIILVPENTLDLLNIFRLVGLNDIVYSESSREVKKERADGRYDSERVLVTLGVEVEKKIVDPLLRRIGFSGRIIYESKKLDLVGKYHTIYVHPSLEIKIESRERFNRLYSFSLNYVEKKERKKILCVTLDNEGVAVAEFSNIGLKMLYSKSISPKSKMLEDLHDSNIHESFYEVVKLVEKMLKEEDFEIVILGSSISVEEFMKFLKKNAVKLLNKIVKRGYTSLGREEGLREALRSGELKDYAEELKPVRDSLEVEEFIKRMSENPEKVALGLREVLESLKMKNVEKVLVAEQFLWEKIVEEEVATLLDEVERGKLNLRVILDGLEASEKILGLGGVVATLYYPLKLSRT
ncbi:MAG: hypothetical protein N3G77_00935 [Nitrososphaeria archaeon]|nr:hypothetical protein [Nitrososphaeria archaeon]